MISDAHEADLRGLLYHLKNLFTSIIMLPLLVHFLTRRFYSRILGTVIKYDSEVPIVSLNEGKYFMIGLCQFLKQLKINE